MKATDYLGLLSDLENEYGFILANKARIDSAWGRLGQTPEDLLLWYSYAYLVHNLYNGFEAYFHRISQFYENGLPPDNWPKVLVDRMSSSIEGYRPAVLASEDRASFQELRAFRHLVRHLYDRDIDPVRIRLVHTHVEDSLRRFPGIHRNFTDVVKRMAAS